jgi:hypothetical protein
VTWTCCGVVLTLITNSARLVRVAVEAARVAENERAAEESAMAVAEAARVTGCGICSNCRARIATMIFFGID